VSSGRVLSLLLVSGRVSGALGDNEIRSLFSSGNGLCSSPFARNNSVSSNFVTRSYVYIKEERID